MDKSKASRREAFEAEKLARCERFRSEVIASEKAARKSFNKYCDALALTEERWMDE